jgi:hypothetical protein
MFGLGLGGIAGGIVLLGLSAVVGSLHRMEELLRQKN